MSDLYTRVQESAQFLAERGVRPHVWAVLGTGLGGVAERIEDVVRIPYAEIPHFPQSTSPGHTGELLAGRLADVPVAVMAGRVHFYEGVGLQEITLPVRVAHALGAKGLLLTSAVGGMSPSHEKGDLVVIDDHINLMGDSPLRGPNDERLGPRFPDMSAPYDRDLLEQAVQLAAGSGTRLHRAVLAAVPGPQLETRAEYRYLARIGADVVGMSTVPEAITAAHCGLRVAALSVVTDLCFPDSLKKVDVEEILAVAAEAAPRLEALLLGLLPHV